MDWFAAGGGGLLIAVRAIHFAATALVTGNLVFRMVVATGLTARQAIGWCGRAKLSSPLGICEVELE